MNTQSHFLINYCLARLLHLKGRCGVRMSAIVWGSLAPDIMIYILSVGTAFYYRFFHGWTIGEGFDHAFDTLFFENEWWIVLHNFFQAPIILITAIVVSWLIMRKAKRGSEEQSRTYTISLWVFVFSVSAFLHTVIDILTHHNDGPLILFPFNLTARFLSPVSYWDGDHYGGIFAIFEGVLNLVCVGYLIYLRVKRVRAKRSA